MDNIKQWCIEQAVKLGKMDYISEAKAIYKEVVGDDWDNFKLVPTGVLELKERYFEQKYGVSFIDVYDYYFREPDYITIYVEEDISKQSRVFVYYGSNPFDGVEMKVNENKGRRLIDYKWYYVYELTRLNKEVRFKVSKMRIMLSGMAYMDEVKEEWNNWGDDTMNMFIERVKRGIEEKEEGLEEKLRSEYRCESLKSYKR